MRFAEIDIPPDWTGEIEEIARATGRTSGEVLREAIAQYLSKTDPSTGLFVNANKLFLKQVVASICHLLHSSVNSLNDNITCSSDYIQQLLQLINLYAKNYPSPAPEIQQYAEFYDLEFMLDDLPKLLSSMKFAANRLCQICQSWSNSSFLDEMEATIKPAIAREALAHYLGKTDSFNAVAHVTVPFEENLSEANPLLRSALMFSRSEYSHCIHKIYNPLNYIDGNLTHLVEYFKELLQLPQLYAKFYSPPVPEIQRYLEAINIELLIEDCAKSLNFLKQKIDNIHLLFNSTTREFITTIDLHEIIDSIIWSLQPQQRNPENYPGIYVVMEYGLVAQPRWNVSQLISVLMRVLILAIPSLEESTDSKFETRTDESDSEFIVPTLKPTLRIRTYQCDRNQIVIQIGDCLIQLSLDSEQRLHAEAEPAIKWANRYGMYFYHGTVLPEKYGKLPPREWQSQWLLSEYNAELRRVLIQGIGYARICTELQATELDSWAEYSLLKIDQFTDIDREPIYLLKMTCPSTGFIHALRVPHNMRSAREAICWVNWGVDPLEFSVQT